MVGCTLRARCTAEVDGDELSLHWSIANENSLDWGFSCPLSERRGKKKKKKKNQWMPESFGTNDRKRYVFGLKLQFHAVKDCLVISFFSPSNKHETYYHENYSRCAPHIKSLPCAHIHTSSTKLLADSQCVRTAEWVASKRALWP